jgi:hypothetical protein
MRTKRGHGGSVDVDGTTGRPRLWFDQHGPARLTLHRAGQEHSLLKGGVDGCESRSRPIERLLRGMLPGVDLALQYDGALPGAPGLA